MDTKTPPLHGSVAAHRGMFAPELAELIFDAAPFEAWEEHRSLREFDAPSESEVRRAA
jgi:hypothetical protein